MVRTVVVTLLFMLFVSGCSKEYVYTAPETEAGTICVTKCQEWQSVCREQAGYDAATAKKQCDRASAHEYAQCEAKAEDDFELCEKNAESDYYGCLKYSANRASCVKAVCVKDMCRKSSCYKNVDYSFCEKDFRACYQQCGGKIEELK